MNVNVISIGLAILGSALIPTSVIVSAGRYDVTSYSAKVTAYVADRWAERVQPCTQGDCRSIHPKASSR